MLTDMSNFKKSGVVQFILIDLRSGLWFVPALIIFCAIFLAIGLVELDQHVDDALRHRWPRLFAIEAEGARSMLAAIAGSMATVVGVAFSTIIVALVLASTQYTSSVLRNFMRDRANQTVLGILIGVYIYCLLVLRTISGANGDFAPILAVLAALLLAVIASAVFIFFIHHISTSIQASEMIAAITRETTTAIDLLFPEEETHDDIPERPPTVPDGTMWHPVPSTSLGYIQSVDLDALVEFAKIHRTIVRMERGMGDFAAQDRPLVSLALSHAPDSDMVKTLNRIYAIDSYRTIELDPAFGIRQLVDIALKALSPSINDTTTAVTCIEHLSVLLMRCVQRGSAAQFRFDGEVLRLIAHQPEFAQLVPLAFNQILEDAEGNTEVLRHMLSAIEHIGSAARHGARIAVLDRQVDAIEEVALRSVKSRHAREEIDDALKRTRAVLGNRFRY
jgi:uncharacterized membrane protein